MSIDKPIAAKIILPLKQKGESGESFIGFSGTLYHNNLIFEAPRELRKTEGSLELVVVFRSRDAFMNWRTHQKIQEYWSPKFESLLSDVPRTLEEVDVIVEIDQVENCQCNTSPFYILQGRTTPFADELTCGSCLKQIPYSQIPVTIRIEEWQRYHHRFYLNWLESGAFEQDALKELTDYQAGTLNNEAERIRAELTAYFKSPVYLYLFVEDPDGNHACLVCGAKGVPSGLKRPSKICERCSMVFD